MDISRMSLQIMQSVCTKPRIYLIYGSYLGTINDLNCAFFGAFFVKWIIYDLVC